MLVDTHCHLNFNSFDQDRRAALERAHQAGVESILIPGVDFATSRQALDLASGFPGVYAAVGLHPTEAERWEPGSEAVLEEMASQPRVVAIGEIGLDYYWDRSGHDMQCNVFTNQLRLAARLGLPVVVHIRNPDGPAHPATEEALDLLAEWQAGLAASGSTLAQNPGVLHSFSDDVAAATRAVAMNFYIGITGPVTFRKATVMQAVASTVPLDRLLIETDAPFLTPHPHRGQRNEPAYVTLIAHKIAELRSLPYDIVAESTTTNAERLFHWRVTI